MTTSQKQASPFAIWCFGLGLILLWLAFSGQKINQYLYKEQQQYAQRLGREKYEGQRGAGSRRTILRTQDYERQENLHQEGPKSERKQHQKVNDILPLNARFVLIFVLKQPFSPNTLRAYRP
ncbi:hypothetical protein [Endozoicomonas sp. 2B-B]